MERLRLAAPKDLTAFSEFIHPDEYPALHHIYFCERLMDLFEGVYDRLLISAPPGAAKSCYSSRDFPAWALGNNPHLLYIQGGHTQRFVENELSKKVRAIVNSPDYRKIFPDINISTETKAADKWELSNGKGSYLGRGVGQGTAGFRSDITGIDDPFKSRQDAESAGQRDVVYNWFLDDMTTRMRPNNKIFVVATRWHVDDLCGRLEEDSAKGRGKPYYIINLPAIAEDNDPIGRANGEPLWGEYYDLAHYMNLKSTLSAKGWNSLYMGKPTDEEGGVLHSDWIARYKELPTREGKPPEGPHTAETVEERLARHATRDPDTVLRRKIVSVDSAIKATERHDYTAITVWYESQSRKHYLAEVVRERVEFPELVKLVRSVCQNHLPDALLVEDKGSGTQYIQTQKGERAPAPVVPIKVNNDTKEFRFDAVAPMFEAGTVLLPERALWLPDYEQELLQFPSGKFDDQVDSTSQYLSWAKPKFVGGTKKLKGF